MTKRYKTKLEYLNINLPLCKLHVMKAGSGKPLIIVPATISELDNWKPLVFFMAQKYEVYFFELPGHGKSTPFKQSFSLDLVSQTIEDLANKLKLNKFSLMGFSFGGILALNTIRLMGNRIEKLILIAPCVSHKAIKYSPVRLFIVKVIHRLLSKTYIKSKLLDIIHNEKHVFIFIRLLNHIGKVEENVKLKNKLLSLHENTLNVLIRQTFEILNADFTNMGIFKQPTFFAMSVNDPLLDFSTTQNFMTDHFKNLFIKRSFVNYHQPPKPYSLKLLNSKYKYLLKKI